MGSTYASVLPVPVSSSSTASMPERTTGHASRWICVGLSMPIWLSASSRCGERPSAPNSGDAVQSARAEGRGQPRGPPDAAQYPRTSGSIARTRPRTTRLSIARRPAERRMRRADDRPTHTHL
eukprot:scaffold77599_cov33-Tisochrysis_lutea.AAC.2